MGRRFVAIIAAGVVALIGVAVLLLYVKSADSRAVAGLEPVSVFLAKEPVPAGTVLKDAVNAQLIVKDTLPKKSVPSDYLKTVDGSNESLLAMADIQPGQYILNSQFGTTPTGRKAISVDPGMVAVTITLSDAQRVGSFLTPGSRIIIADTYSVKGGGSSTSSADVTRSRVLLPDVLVLAVGQSSLTPTAQTADQTAAAGTGSTSLVTLALTPDDALRVVHGQATGDLYALLRGADDTVDLGRIFTNTESSLFARK
jgi:pilus assembly protein CpaB